MDELRKAVVEALAAWKEWQVERGLGSRIPTKRWLSAMEVLRREAREFWGAAADER